MDSKNAVVRKRLTIYFEIVLKTYDIEIIEQNQDLIELFLIKVIDDQNQEVRQLARKCFVAYHNVIPDRSYMLLQFGIETSQAKKQIMLELDINDQFLKQK